MDQKKSIDVLLDFNFLTEVEYGKSKCTFGKSIYIKKEALDQFVLVIPIVRPKHIDSIAHLLVEAPAHSIGAVL